MIILNEKDYAEECLRDKTIKDSVYRTIFILAKYYRHYKKYKKKRIIKEITEFIWQTYPDYSDNKQFLDEYINKVTDKAKDHKLYQVGGVWVTKKELNIISTLKRITLKRLAFTLLCLAKLSVAKNPKNKGWVNNDLGEIFSLARVTGDKGKMMNELYRLELIELPVRLDNLSSRVTFIHDESEKILYISDFRELGYEYMNYLDDSDFIRCKECGRLLKNSKNGTRKYCSDCVAPQRIKTVICIDCGKAFEVSALNNRTNRCPDCYDIYRKKYISQKNLLKYHRG